MKKIYWLLLPCCLSGCGSITGLQNAQSDFACSVDMPAQCTSISEVHASKSQTAVLHQRDHSETSASARQTRAPYEIEKRVILKVDQGQSFTTSDPLLSQTPLMVPQRLAEEILTVWIAPFIDKDGDLHDAQRIFVTTHQARWAPDTLVQKRSASTSHWLEPLSDQPIPSRTQRP